MSRRILPLIVSIGLLAAAAAPAIAASLVPTPRATELPVAATNRPFLGAARTRQPVDLGVAGYVEKEYLVTGLAGVPDWNAQGMSPAVRLRSDNHPYVTRMLVRRPAERARFSGRVVVELLDGAGGSDTAPLWGLSAAHFLRDGDAWVGLTVMPAAAEALRRFDSMRYKDIRLAAPSSQDCRNAPTTPDQGLAWDVIAQAGALLRSSSKENPLVDFDVRRLVAGGYGRAGSYVVTYVNVAHDTLRLGNERPVFDAYVDVAGVDGAAPLHDCAASMTAEDPRRQVPKRDVPVITVMTQTDVGRTQWMRRSDGDAEDDVYRLYEIAGMGHAGPFPAGQPSSLDAKIAGIDASADVVCLEPASTFPAGLAMNAIWQQLDELLVDGKALSSVPRIETGEAGVVRVDTLGNAIGGWRLPQLDLPLAVYRATNRARPDAPAAQGLCALTPMMRRLEPAKLKALYGNRATYLKKFNAALETAVSDRRLTAADASAVRAQMAKAVPQF
ncbi:MAG: hypothetical protein RLZZ200_181 [Pseudomonadota bacterium]|jgi:hypothetical protein